MTTPAPLRAALGLRLAALLFPPAGLYLLWRQANKSLGAKLLGTLGLLLYSLIYCAAVIWLLMAYAGLLIEWRGGYLPSFTFRPTRPDYDKLEARLATQAHFANSEQTNQASHPKTNAQPYWTDFRGPSRDGLYAEQPIQTAWPAEGLRPLWKQPCGGGYASFVVGQGSAFTIEQRRQFETVVAYELTTGRQLWTNNWPAHFDESMGGDGPRATPTYHQARLYALGAEGELRCLEAADGKTVWSRNVLRDSSAPNLFYGMAASPLVREGKVIVQAGGPAGKSVVACDANSGELAWHALDDPAAYSSPMHVELAGQPQLLIVTKTRAVGLGLADGKLLWEHPWIILHQNRNIAQPVLVSTNRIFLSGGYGTGCEVIEVSHLNGAYQVKSLWRNKSLKNKFTSSVFWQGHIYGLDEDILTCLDAATGERRWKEGRYGYGQLISASGHLLILCGNGDVALVRAVPDGHQEICRFPAIAGKTWNHPALAHGYLLVRNQAEMACFDLNLLAKAPASTNP